MMDPRKSWLGALLALGFFLASVEALAADPEPAGASHEHAGAEHSHGDPDDHHESGDDDCSHHAVHCCCGHAQPAAGVRGADLDPARSVGFLSLPPSFDFSTPSPSELLHVPIA